METQGSLAEQEDPKPSHQLHKLKIKSTWSTSQTLMSMEYIKKTLRAPIKENALVLTAVDIGGKNTQE